MNYSIKFKLNEMVDTLKISIERVHHIIHEHLGMRKLCAKWVPRELTFDKKQRRVDDSEQCLGRSINSDYYIVLFDRLKDELAEKWRHLKKKKVLLHQDNTPCHKSVKRMAKINELGFELLPHPPYSPDLAPSYYFLFSNLKRMLAYFEANDKSYYKNGIKKLEGRYNQCITLKGSYVE
ncbi:hypothetical protein GWI33_017709 [Rhynchophorus ferrugineus]|uniref:Transposase n=1 Tax=Rhynchophorus ferrugineus TaxID=354439 RepID=A0A834HXU1_RHYFE|nr:hypothetical protein GWI33_017709 [Rhynchophorus ferrugineus]